MTKATISRSMRRLPVTDRIELLDELWFSIAADTREIPVTQWQKQMIDERLEEIKKHPHRGMTHAEFKKKLRGAMKRFKRRERNVIAP